MSILSAVHGGISTILSNLFVTVPYPETSFQNKTAIVTGSNVGLGLEASRHLARLGVEKLIMAVRNVEKGEAARLDVLQSTGRNANTVEVWEVDMASYESVKSFAARVETLPRIDLVLANAGIAMTVFSTAEDNEASVVVNVISTFLLCILLLPKLRQSSVSYGITPRVVIPNSALHYMASTKELEASLDIFESLNDPKTSNMAGRYPLTKLLVIYAVRELAERSKDSKEPLVIFNTPNPSFCKSELRRDLNSPAFKMYQNLLARSSEEGSRTLVDGLVAGPDSHGQYLTNCHVQVYVLIAQ